MFMRNARGEVQAFATGLGNKSMEVFVDAGLDELVERRKGGGISSPRNT
jgi:hypothetical protein